MGVVEAFLEILERPTIGAIVVEMMVFMTPVWIGFLAGVLVGWAWKPSWVSFLNCKFDCSTASSSDLIPSPVKKKGFGSISMDDEVVEEQVTLTQNPNCR